MGKERTELSELPAEVRAVIEGELRRRNEWLKSQDCPHPVEVSSVLSGTAFDRSALSIPAGCDWESVENVEGEWQLQTSYTKGDPWGEQVYYYLTRETGEFFPGWNDEERKMARFRREMDQRDPEKNRPFNGHPDTF